MNQRVVSIAIVGLAIVGGIIALLTMHRPAPAPPPARAAVVESPTPKPAAAPATPPPEPVRPAVEPPRPTEPRRRVVAPPPAAASAVDLSIASPDTVTLHIDSDVPDAQVFVDRTFVGKTPLSTTDVKAGPHTVNVSAPGFEGVAQSVNLKPGLQDVVVKLREVRLDASIDAVHKHRVGSCKGRLIATPQGIRYETTDKDDGFRAGLLDLETFEVDYLQKNLRIKPTKGKRYDFTDPDGNADRLFVFHRDVDKARERLKKGDTPAAP